MKLLIAGSRDIRGGVDLIESACYLLRLQGIFDLEEHEHGDRPEDQQDFEIVSGGCPTGVDAAAKLFAITYEDHCHYKEFQANWDTHGKAAGPIRNSEMAEYADALLLIWDGVSRGSADMRRKMINKGKPVYEVIVRHPNGW